MLCLASCVEVVFVERGVVYSQVVFAQILSGGSLCVDAIVKILLCEGGDVELGARTSKHILVFLFDPLSLTLSLSLLYCALHHFILFISYMFGLIV